MCVWAAVFAGMSAVHAVGDDHPGQWLPFWREACENSQPHAGVRPLESNRIKGSDPFTVACRYLRDVQAGFCNRGSSWSCHELDILDTRQGYSRTMSEPPTLDDYPIILRGSKGPLAERTPLELLALACRQGWSGTCSS